MTGEKPQVGLDVIFGADEALAEFAAIFANVGDTIEHQHRRQRQLGVALPKKLAAAAGQQVFLVKAVPPALHRSIPCRRPHRPKTRAL